MPYVTVLAKLVDGSAMDFSFASQEFFAKLDALEADGYEGRRLIDALISDDWGPPPVLIKITGLRPGGRYVDRVIGYD